MQPVRIPLLRAALLFAAIMAIGVLVPRGAGPALASSFNPQNSVSVSDPSPGAHADLRVNFTLDAPDAFPNVTDSPAIQFLPKDWGVSTDAPVGAIGGKFDALSTLGILGILPCTFQINFAPDMYVASVDPGNPTSALDLEGHPGGPGYSGQFVPDPDDPDGKYGGITRYPDFLADMFPPEEIGPPLVRLWGGQNVLLAAISLNIVTFAPGQLPGYPASLGYPTVIVLLDPVAPVDLLMLTITSDLCSPLNLVNTNFGISKDNPSTAADESGHPLLTNPHSQKEHVFTLIATAQPDADEDGIENWLDTCLFVPNIEDTDGRLPDADDDGLDGACDPDPGNPSPPSPDIGVPDEDSDGYANRADNCPTVANGIHMDPNSVELKQVGEFVFPFATYFDVIGPDNQADADGDRIGDACEGAEVGAQCANDLDDDGDGAVNDGCPTDILGPESGAQCDNDLDDDGDGKVNDGCPQEPLEPKETGAQCENDLDDDGDGLVNDGCPRVGDRAERVSAGQQRIYLEPDNVIASSNWPGYPPEDAFDGNTVSSWCSLNDGNHDPGEYIEAQFNAPGVTIETIDLQDDQWAPNEAFHTGEITMSNGFYLFVDLGTDGEASLDIPDQTGITWVRFTGLSENLNSYGDACLSEFALNLEILLIGAECNNALDDDGDGAVNDGCPQEPLQPKETGSDCDDAVDDDGDGKVNDGCPAVIAAGFPEATCDDAVDDDGDGLVNDGCPAVDPGDAAKNTVTGHVHVVTIENSVLIFKHGIKLNSLGGPPVLNKPGARTYTVDVSNISATDPEDIQVALRVVEGCATVNGNAGQDTAVVSVGPGGSGTASFTVDWTGCAAGEYTVQADACHAGDAAPAGFFGVGACPGVSDGKIDPNPLDDAPRSKTVDVGSP